MRGEASFKDNSAVKRPVLQDAENVNGSIWDDLTLTIC
jgi:hypothetical protein